MKLEIATICTRQLLMLCDSLWGGEMFEGWGEFYLLAGSAAAVLIGLIFVVVTLMQDRSRSSVLSGSKLYMGPVVLNVTFVLVLSAAALIPRIEPKEFAIVAGAVSVWGAIRGLISTQGIAALKGPDKAHWTDMWFYGVIPTVLYLLLAVISFAAWRALPWAAQGLAVVITGGLLLCIRNEWDLVTWLAPRPDSPSDSG
jgi:nitrate/nitrite transporter NarK